MANTPDNILINSITNCPSECYMQNCGMRDNGTSNPYMYFCFRCTLRCSERNININYPGFKTNMYDDNSTKGRF